MYGRNTDSAERPGSRSRSTSLSSDSQFSRITLLSPPPVTPKPAFIAPSAASQIITIDQELRAVDVITQDESKGTTTSALVTHPALVALNGFLDHILFNILSAAKSTQLSCVRLAIADVLKPRLAKEVVSAADDELNEYMGDTATENEQFEVFDRQRSDDGFDLIRMWKLARLRCMVYTRLGDMEEDDEDEYIIREGLMESEDAREATSYAGSISPAAAIFLTSIIEYIGEQALIIAGETARSQLAAKATNHTNSTKLDADRDSIARLVIEDLDMEKLALNPTLGRLWRTWRKSLRSQTLGRAASKESFRRPLPTQSFPSASRKSSIATADESPFHFPSMLVVEEDAMHDDAVDPACIPLPKSQHDALNKESAGSTEPDDEILTLEAVVAHKVRPRSLMVVSPPPSASRSPASTSSSPVPWPRAPELKCASHSRSKSLPDSSCFPDQPFGDEQDAPPGAGETSLIISDEGKRLETMYEHDESVDITSTQTGIAISTDLTDQCGSTHRVPDGPVINNLQKHFTEGHEADVESLFSDASMEVVTSRASSARASAVSVSDQQQMMEIMKKQEMCEKPELRYRSTQIINKELLSEERIRPMQGGPLEEPSTARDASWPLDTSNLATPQFTTSDNISDKEHVYSKAADSVGRPAGEGVPPSSSVDSEHLEAVRERRRPSRLVLLNRNTRDSGKITESSSTERAAVQLVSVRPSPSVVSSANPKLRRSDSFTSTRRPVTSGSPTSQVSTKLKGLIGRSPGDVSPRYRSSSETSRASRRSGDSGNLEKLIKSEETLHFTLTPKSVREIGEFDIPEKRPVTRSNGMEYELGSTIDPCTDNIQRYGPSTPQKAADLISVSKLKSTTLPEATEWKRSQQRQKVYQARDARMTSESTRDFADFIKSTGPPSFDGSDVPHIRDAKTPKSPVSFRPPELTRPANGLSSPQVESVRYQADKALQGARSEPSNSSELAPEIPSVLGSHRVPHPITPFRGTAVDSGDPEVSDWGKEPTRTSPTSTLGGSVADKSFTSVGSHTGLLGSTTYGITQKSINAKITYPSSRKNMDKSSPARKQRRVRDPYAIDSDDEDSSDDMRETQMPKREEESLVDFLRNSSPLGSQSSPLPFMISSNHAQPLDKQSLNHIASARPPIHQQTGSYSMNQASYAGKVGMERNGGSWHGPPASPGRQTETGALADFLRNTSPPGPPVAEKKDWGANSLSRLFARRKRVEV